jgi:hypothetical protein
MKRVGFFSDLPHGSADGPSLSELIGRLDEDTADRIAEYLYAGTVILPTLGTRCFDVLSDGKEDIGPLEILSDGEWAWPSDLPYFVAKYHVGLPEAFVEHAGDHGWKPPKLSDEKLALAADSLIEGEPDAAD